MKELSFTVQWYKGLFEKSKPFLIKSIPYIVVGLLGYSMGGQATESRISEDCKYISKFRIATNGYNCVRQ
jgi:hypothetical protein